MKRVALALAVSLLATACLGGSAAPRAVPRTSTFGPGNPVRTRLLAEAHAARNIPVAAYGRAAGPPPHGIWAMPGSSTNHLELETVAPDGQLWDLFISGTLVRFERVEHG